LVLGHEVDHLLPTSAEVFVVLCLISLEQEHFLPFNHKCIIYPKCF
jgi:hypothetical protein